ncbi:unnamed protein product [Moneuplotes crassus]|uniref:Uncharacterized protein n=1 Tax=Euplotes crassus TaxID=5936 RepID=A0AAD1XXH4_EUPCR|nr:unnamed protein product [Moneuplotes crassus]
MSEEENEKTIAFSDGSLAPKEGLEGENQLSSVSSSNNAKPKIKKVIADRDWDTNIASLETKSDKR